MALASLAYLLPLDLATGNRVAVRVCSAQDRRVTGLGNMVWEPAMKAAPDLTINLWNGDFKNSVDPGSANFSINMNVVKKTWPDADRYDWNGAPVAIYADEMGTAWPWTMRFSGVISSRTRKKQTLAITADVDKAAFDKNILTGTYAGTGGVEGGSDIKNRLKPLVLGWASNVEPILINAVYNVYQFSAYGAIEGVIGLYERASSFGAAIGDYASYEALVAATIPAGKWATCLAQGLVRLGAPAYGVITGDIKGHKVGTATPRLTGAVIKAMATIASVDSLKINTASLDALDATVPYPVNVVITSQTTFLAQANAMALACNAQGGISLNGTYFAIPVNFALTPAMTLDALGRSLPQVVSSEELEVSVPYWKTIMGAAQSWRVHSADEISFAAALVEQGLYSATATYREGNIVELSNGSRWLYTATTATTGNAPPSWPTASNTWWSNLTPPTSAANITYASGATLESLKPAQAGADVTSSNVAASVTGQGPLATVSSAAPYANANVPLGQNLIINSDMTLMDAGFSATYPLGFEFGWQGNMTNIASINWADSRIMLADKTFAMQRTLSGAAPTPANCVFDGVQSASSGAALARFCIPIQPGDTLFASAFVGHQNCSAGGAVVGYLDENGAYVGEAGVNYASVDIGSTPVTSLRRDQLGRSTGFVTVPADGTFSNGTGRCRWARIWTRFNLTGSPATARGVSSGLMLAKVASGQTAVPPYTTGPSDRQATYGAMTGSSLQSGSLGVLSDGQVVTGQGTAAAITNQGDLATKNRSSLAFGQNAVVNSDLARGSYGFTLAALGTIPANGNNAVSVTGIGVNLNASYSGIRNVMWATVGTGGANWMAGSNTYVDAFWTRGRWNGGTMADQRLFGVSVKQGDRIFARSLMARHRCATTMYALIFDKDGNLVEAPEWSGGRNGGGQNGDPANFDQIGGCTTVNHPAAATMALMWRMHAADQPDPYLFMTEPAFGVLPAGQEVLPPYNTGREDPLSDQTSTGTAAGISGQSSWATYNGLTPGNVAGQVQYLDTSGNLQSLLCVGDRKLTLLLRADGTTAVTEAAVVTSQGVAGSISGQSNWATYTGLTPGNVAGQVQYLDTSGNLQSLLRVGDRKLTLLLRADGSTAVTEAAVVTSQGVAGSISGQSSWATYTGLLPSNVAGQVQYLDTSGNLSGLQRITDRKFTLLVRADGSTAVTEDAVVTSQGTAAAITNQGSLATRNDVTTPYIAAGAVLSTTMATATNMVWTGLTPHLVCSITIQPYSSTSTILIMGSWQAQAQNSSNIQFVRCEVVNQNTNEVISTTEYRNTSGLAQGLVIPFNATLSGISAQTTLNVVLYPPYAAGTTTTTMALVSITALEIKK